MVVCPATYGTTGKVVYAPTSTTDIATLIRGLVTDIADVTAKQAEGWAKIDADHTLVNTDTAAIKVMLDAVKADVATDLAVIKTYLDEIKTDYNATLAKMDADFADVANASVDYAATNPVATTYTVTTTSETYTASTLEVDYVADMPAATRTVTNS